MTDSLAAKSHQRRDFLRGVTAAVGFTGGVGVTSLAMAGNTLPLAQTDNQSAITAGRRVPAYPTLADAEAAVCANALSPGDLVDILGYAGTGDGGGFRGIVLDAPQKVLPGLGMIEPTELLLDVRMFGSTDTPASSTRTIQLALDWSSARQHIVHLPARFNIREPLKVGFNAGLVGLGAGFRSGFRPIDCPALMLDGNQAQGGFVFNVLLRDFGVWGDQVRSRQPFAMKLCQCYRSSIENVTFRGYAVGGEGTASVIELRGKQNHMIFDRLTVLGESAGEGGCGIKVANSKDGGLVHFSHLDVEKTETCVIVEPGARAHFFNSYFERFDTAIRVSPGVKSTIVNGGIFRFQNKRAAAIRLAAGRYDQGEHIAIIGSAFQAPREGIICRGLVAENVSWANPNPIEIVGIDRDAISISPAVFNEVPLFPE